MAGDKEKAVDKDQEIIIQDGDLNDDLSEEDLEKAAGAVGGTSGISIKCPGD